MVNFKNLIKKKRMVDVRDLSHLFESLDRHSSHTELRPAQHEALTFLTGRRDERDLILKLNTGVGKTALGLLYLESFMEECQTPVAYLSPTIQLIEQVRAEAARLGIKTVPYAAGDTYPDVSAIRGQAIIVCTYAKLFNARSTFDRSGVTLRPTAFVLDDAHAGVEHIRDAFTLRIIRGVLFSSLLRVLEESCRHYNAGRWLEIESGNATAIMEVPYWIWRPLASQCHDLIASHGEDYPFVWPYIRDLLPLCRCVVSGTVIEIIPDLLPVHKCRAYHDAPHRLFMSATLADDAVLVRELGCALHAAETPIVPASDKGLGERMVLAPSLVDKSLDRHWVMDLCQRLSARIRIVVLSSSEPLAREWESFGASVFLGEDVAPAVQQLRSGAKTHMYAVFAQRYDGIDLPDDACRILVLDGIPFGEGITDRLDGSLTSLAGGTRNRLIYRIEQGMGRAVRSYVDYAVVILAGPELAHFIAKHDVLSRMNPATRAQLRLGLELADLSRQQGGDPGDAVHGMLTECLKRDEGWKQFYMERMEELLQAEKITAPTQKALLLADAERQAFDAALANDPHKAVTILRGAVNAQCDPAAGDTSWYIQKIARYLNAYSPAEALEAQRAAYERNMGALRPPMIVRRPASAGDVDIGARILEWGRQYANPNGVIAAIQELRGRLSFEQKPEVVEQGLADLAALLGADGSRPEKEYGEGPDCLWLWPTMSLVIEAKTGNQNSLHATDAGQLLRSLQWYGNQYPTRQTRKPIIAARVNVQDEHSGFPPDTRVLTEDHVRALLTRIEAFHHLLASQPVIYANAKSILKALRDHGLAPEQFVAKYTSALQ